MFSNFFFEYLPKTIGCLPLPLNYVCIYQSLHNEQDVTQGQFLNRLQLACIFLFLD